MSGLAPAVASRPRARLSAVARLLAWLAPEQPAEPSWLDHADGVGRPMGANCCGREPVVTVAGWTLCAEHDRAA